MRIAGFILEIFVSAVTAFNVIVYIWRARILRQLPECDAVDRLGWLDAAACFLQECWATAVVVLAVPLGWIVGAGDGDQGSGAGRPEAVNTQLGQERGPVVLVHGWGLNSGSMLLLRRRLQRDGWGPVWCFNYVSHAADVERAAAELRAFLEPLTASTAQPITLIGHSLGGLVIRYYARRYPARRVRRLMTLGTPHHGTELAHRWLAKLAPESPFLTNLNAADRTPQQFDVITILSTFDAVVLPPASASYDGAFNIQVNNVGHNALLTSRRVYGLIAENLAAPWR